MKNYKDKFDLTGFAQEIQRVRVQRKLSQEQFAEIISISANYY